MATTTKHLSVRDIHAAQSRKLNKRHESFERVLSMCHKTISKSINVLRNNNHCLFEVPEFVIGYPLYDLNECITWVVEQLTGGGGFYVRYFFPRILYISWGPPQPITVQALPGPLPQPQAKRKVASTIRCLNAPSTTQKGTNTNDKVICTKKKTGKFVLNLS